MNKSLSDIAHDITIALLPKSLEELEWSMWEEETTSYNSFEFVEQYATLHQSVLSELKKKYGENGEQYPK